MNSEEIQRKMADHERKVVELERRLVEYERKIVDFQLMHAEEMQRNLTDHEQKLVGLKREMDDYEQRIMDYELKRVRYERKIVRLENSLFYKEYEILSAKFTMVEALPELNAPCGSNPFEELIRTPGSLDEFIFHKACREAWDKEGKAGDEMEMSAEAVNLYRLWTGLINDEQWELYPAQGLYGLIENSDLEELQDKYGASLYNAIKTAWVEILLFRRTGVTLKPWNHDAGREQTLSELLELLPSTIEDLRSGH
ncbi:unnamed protein product [Eruca vesicaria subsp. sativa]|uniref:Factor of DNA methylation 1-5/IDN2 domain-containing protein n=1 Tax=Eruca vesicaria subsp. sativa TaxID=29727 RepID=A0ABC8KSR7_ERUVS|nr:unnamed protein product [Eruca vesicaria subsp. sativa]